MVISDKLIKYQGKILFEPDNVTKKHEKQSEWKKIAMVVLEGDICEYYGWFLEKRFGLKLNKPLRKAHVTFLNDNFLRDSNLSSSDDDKLKIWHQVKEKYDGKEIDVILNVDFHTNGNHWWQIIPHEYRFELQEIRNELGLDRPWAGMHLTIGYATHYNEIQSQYLHVLYKKGFVDLHEDKYNKN